jgi:hypothetical protein
MKRNHKELDAVLDRVAAGIRSEEIDVSVVESAADRVWARLSKQSIVELPETKAVEEIRGCADFQALIPAYLRKELSDARTLLLEDHTRECIPCRKALKAARNGSGQSVSAVQPFKKATLTPQTPVWKWAIAAMFVIGIGLAAFTIYRRVSVGARATIQAANGTVFRVTETESRALGVGEEISKGERIRTAKDAGAVVKLEDGSLVEMRERSELSLSQNSDGTTIHLNRGNVIVEAAKQKGGHLYVATDDALVSVTGTIFSVNNGTKGSRVAVVEGEVHVNHAGDEKVLHPGDETTTSTSLEMIPIQEEIAWSRNAERYGKLMLELNALKRELDQKVPHPGVRYSTRLLDLVPDGTVVYGALPNLSATLVESHRIMQERIQQNAALREWWKQDKNSSHGGPNLDQIIEEINQFGKYLGAEIVASAKMGERGPEDPLVLAELSDATGFRPFLEQKIAAFTTTEKGAPKIRIIDDPLTATQAGNPKVPEVLVWINGDLLAAAPRLQQLQQLAVQLKEPETNGFKATSFYARLAETYKAGAGLIVAADLEKIIGRMVQQSSNEPNAAKNNETYKQLGLMNLKHFVVEQKDVEGKTSSRAMLSFKEQRSGIASWLAAPGPMGALNFISPDANMVAAFVVREPSSLVDELLGYLDTASPRIRQDLKVLEADYGLKLREDFAAPLGGEFAFAIDGPILPTPSWKMVIEVYDPARLQQTFERVVEEVNKHAAQEGGGGLVWERSESGGHTFYTLKSVNYGVEIHYTYANGYFVAAPSRALLERSLKYRESGFTLLRSPRFISTLPADGNVNFSAIFYHDLAPLLEPIAGQMEKAAKDLPEAQQRAIRATADAPPTLAYAYAQGDRIIFAADSEGGPFGLSPATLMGLPNSFEMQHILGQAMHGKKPEVNNNREK